MNIGVHVSLPILVSLVCMPSSGITGSYGISKMVIFVLVKMLAVLQKVKYRVIEALVNFIVGI